MRPGPRRWRVAYGYDGGKQAFGFTQTERLAAMLQPAMLPHEPQDRPALEQVGAAACSPMGYLAAIRRSDQHRLSQTGQHGGLRGIEDVVECARIAGIPIEAVAAEEFEGKVFVTDSDFAAIFSGKVGAKVQVEGQAARVTKRLRVLFQRFVTDRT